MRQLQQFKGLIGSPVNHNNTHWGLLILDRKGKPFYYDSLGRKVNKRIHLIAQYVPRLIHFVPSPD
jgi:Ulp1 family protease